MAGEFNTSRYRAWGQDDEKRSGRAAKCKICGGATRSQTGICASCTVELRIENLITEKAFAAVAGSKA
jgi:hypothetical protein